MTDNDRDAGSSSEDLVRQARDGLFGDPDSPGIGTEHSRVESSLDSEDEVVSTTPTVDEYAEFLQSEGETSGALSSLEPEPPAAPTLPPAPSRQAAQTDPFTPAAPAPSPLSEDELESTWAPPAPETSDRRSWDPTWVPGQSGSTEGYGGGAPVGAPDPTLLPPAPTRRSGSGRSRIGGWLIVGLIVLGFAAFAAFDNTTNVATLSAGDCIEDPGEVTEIQNVEAVGCDEPHEVEVIAVVTLTGPGTADGAPYPGQDQIFEDGLAECEPRFSSYVGIAYSESVYWIDAWTPVAEGWRDGDREVLCVVYEVTDNFDLKSNTFSARNAAR